MIIDEYFVNMKQDVLRLQYQIKCSTIINCFNAGKINVKLFKISFENKIRTIKTLLVLLFIEFL